MNVQRLQFEVDICFHVIREHPFDPSIKIELSTLNEVKPLWCLLTAIECFIAMNTVGLIQGATELHL